MKSVQEILNTVLVDDSINTQIGTQQAFNTVFDEANAALRVTGTGGGGGLTAVATDETLTGDGTVGDPLSVVSAGSAEFWKTVTDFTATPASTSTLTMTADLSDTIMPGMGLRYAIGEGLFYGVVTAITSNLLTIAGVSLTGTVSSLEYLSIPVIIYPEMMIDGEFTELSAITTGFKTKMYLPVSPVWQNIPAYLCRVQIATVSDDTGASTQATVNITIGGNAVLSTALTIPDGVRTSTVVQIDPDYYRIKTGDILELTINPPSGGTPAYNAADLFVEMIFVPEIA